MLIPSALPEFDEIGRCTEATKRAYTDGVLVIIDDMAVPGTRRSAVRTRKGAQRLRVDGRDPAALPRLADRQLADEVLEQRTQNAPTLLDAVRQS